MKYPRTCIVRFLVFLLPGKKKVHLDITNVFQCKDILPKHRNILTWVYDQVSEFQSSLASCINSCLYMGAMNTSNSWSVKDFRPRPTKTSQKNIY